MPIAWLHSIESTFDNFTKIDVIVRTVRNRGAILSLVFVTACALAHSAEDKPATPKPAPASTKSSPVVYTPPANSTPAALAAKPTPAAKQEGEDEDGVLHLPSMQITKEPTLKGKEKDLRNAKDQLDRALKLNPGLKMVPFAKMNNAIALEMAKESREAAARARLTEHVESLPATDDERAKEEIRQMRAATARPNTDWQTTRR